MWNEAELKRPPLITMEVPKARFVKNLHHSLTRLIQNEPAENEEFSYTAALLSRLIARRKNSFRRMIGFRALLMLNSAVARLLRVDLKRDMESFLTVLPDMAFGQKEIAALPTRNFVDFILLRLLTVYDIHHRIQNCSRDAAAYFAELMRANNFLDLNVILISVLAKLRSLNVILGNRFVSIYNVLIEYRELFPSGNQKPIITAEVDMPRRLKPFELQTSTKDEIKTSNQILLAPNKIKSRKSADMGTEVERKNNVFKPPTEFQIDQLKTVKDIKCFIISEEKKRKKNLSQCTTKNIKDHLWAGAQKIFERKLQNGDEKKAMNIFRKFLSSNI